MIRYFFTSNILEPRGETHYGVYSGDNLFDLGYAFQSGSLNIQGYLSCEMLRRGDFNLFPADVRTTCSQKPVKKTGKEKRQERRWKCQTVNFAGNKMFI